MSKLKMRFINEHCGCWRPGVKAPGHQHWQYQYQLEQLERLRSEDTPRRPVITLTIDQFILNPKSILLISSYRIPRQKKVKAEKIRKICEKI